MAKEVLICNCVFTSSKGTPTAVAARIRGEVNGKTVKIAPHLFHGDYPLPGEAIFAEYDALEDTGGNYRVMRNGKVSIATASEQPPTPPSPAEDPIF